MRRVSIKTWTPTNDSKNFHRFYVTDVETGENLGYIQANLYFDKFFQVDMVKSLEYVGDEQILKAIVAIAEARQIEKIGKRDFADIDRFLMGMSQNGLLARPYKMSAKRFAEKRAATQKQVWEVQI